MTDYMAILTFDDASEFLNYFNNPVTGQPGCYSAVFGEGAEIIAVTPLPTVDQTSDGKPWIKLLFSYRLPGKRTVEEYVPTGYYNNCRHRTGAYMFTHDAIMTDGFDHTHCGHQRLYVKAKP